MKTLEGLLARIDLTAREQVLDWSPFVAGAVTVVVYLLNYPLAKYDLYVHVA